MDQELKNQELERFAIPDAVRFEAGNGSLTRAVLSTPQSSAHVYLHGAHITHFQSRDQKPLLFLSDNSAWNEQKAIRGGVPIIFPWFGPNARNADLPAHGFARVNTWQVESTQRDDGITTLVLSLEPNETSRALWPHQWLLHLTIQVGSALEMKLEVRNEGDVPFRYEEALHTYLAVSDVRKIQIEGLNQTRYIDKMDGAKHKIERAESIRIIAETDRVYLDTQATCIMRDANRRIAVEKSGSDSTVVWNPWVEKARALNDLGDDEWPRFVCVESGAIGENARTLNAGESHVLTLRLAA